MFSRLYFVLPFAIAAFAVPTLLQAETLKDVYQHALEFDHRFKAAQATRDAGMEALDLNRAALLPQINAQIAHRQSDSDSALTNDSTDTTANTASVTLQQSIIDLGAWQRYKQGQALVDLAEASFRNAEHALILRTAQAYFDALNAVDNLTTSVAEEEALFHQLEQSKQRFEVGLTAITEVHEAQAAYDSATANRLISEGSLGTAFEALEVITGKSYQQLAPVSNKLPTVPPTPADPEHWVTVAMENSAELAAAKHRMRSAKKAADAAKSGHLPTLTGELGYSKDDIERNSQPFEDSDGASIALRLSIPIFSGGGTSAARRRAYNEYIAELETYKQTTRSVRQDVRTAYINVITSAAAVKARQQAIVSSQSALEATQAGYDVGTRDLVDVLNAQRSLYASQRNFFNALYSYILATLQLKQSAGVLSGDDITQMNQYLDPGAAENYKRQPS